jgi:hypothetical protein
VGNLFDKLQSKTVQTIYNTFGYMVSWTPAGGGPALTAKCGYKEPTEKYTLGEVDYSPNSFQFEYESKDLPGLYESVQANTFEHIFIYEIGADVSTGIRFKVDSFKAMFDGKTLHALIEKY